MERRLAAILAADVVGYSRLVGADEEGALRALAECRALIESRVSEHGGRIFGGAGDSVVVEFASPVEAVRCAADIQDGIARRNAEIAEDRRMWLRVGVNLGDVVVDGDNLLGDGVNVAARLESRAEPGGILISDDVRRLTDGRLDLPLEDLGPQALKNIARPVRVHRVVLGGKPIAGESRPPATHGSARPAIAVLPFVNLSADPEQEYFSDGLTDDLITALGRWHSFDVIARNSSFAHKGRTQTATAIAATLGAGYLLQGSVRRVGDRARVSAQLIDGGTGHELWSQRYDRELDDIFAIQDDIVQCIAAVAAPELARAELVRASAKRPEDLGAWDLCQQGAALLRERTAEANAKGRACFERAVGLRPDYAVAHAGLAMSYSMDILIGAARDRAAAATRAMDAARTAVRLDEGSAWAHHELSTAYQWLGRVDDALAEARIAVALNPSDTYALHALGNKSDLAGDPEGIAHMEKAQRLNPADAQLHPHLTFLARAYLNAGDPAAAVDRARQALRRRPDYAPAHYILALALGTLGAMDEARAALAEAERLSPGLMELRKTWQPYAAAKSNERLVAALNRVIDRR